MQVQALQDELFHLRAAPLPVPESPEIAVLARDPVPDQGQEALGGAGEGELLPPGARRVREAVSARDARAFRLHAVRFQNQ